MYIMRMVIETLNKNTEDKNMQKRLNEKGQVIDYSYISPLGISILIHYHVRGDVEYIGTAKADSPAVKDLIEKFLKMGLLKMENGVVVSNREAIAMYISALTKVPLPRLKQKWVIED